MQVIKFWFDMSNLAKQKGRNDLTNKVDDMLFDYAKKLFFDKDNNVGDENGRD